MKSYIKRVNDVHANNVYIATILVKSLDFKVKEK